MHARSIQPVVVGGPTGSVTLGDGSLVFIAGPCALESLEMGLAVARRLREAADQLGCGLIFKASFDKANRTSAQGYRGPGLDEGLEALATIRAEVGIPVTTDVHLPDQAAVVGSVVDLLQIPAFLCRQTDLLLAAAATGKPVNVKKGQFLSAPECGPLLEKLGPALLTERGTFFGYHDLVVDYRNLERLRALGAPVVFDATHSAQRPGLRGSSTGGERAHIPALARAAVAVGVDAVFLEVHPDPENARSDSATQLSPDSCVALLRQLVALHRALDPLG